MTAATWSPKFEGSSVAGLPLPGGKLYTYAAGTTTPLATFTDQSGTVPNTNPVILDAAGRANVWLQPSVLYKLRLDNALGVTVWTVDNFSVADPAEAGQLAAMLASGNGASLVATQGTYQLQLKKTLEDRIRQADVVDFAVEYLTASEIATIRNPYPMGTATAKPTVDITAKLIQAIADLGGSSDITSSYLYSPARVLQLPAGAMGLDLDGLSRILVERNNIVIAGRGMFNTRLCHIGTGQPQEMIRFKNAYCCGLLHLTIDGGLPFTPGGGETYGAQIPVVLDQVAHWYSDGLNICNYRHRGMQCIHVWESCFGNDFRIFNGGWFRVPGSAPGHWMFDNFRQESFTFPGSESNQIYCGKLACSGNGGIVHWVSPVFNMRIDQIVAEGRTYQGYVPAGIDTSKYRISGLSNTIVVGQAYHYFHDQPTASVGTGAVLYDFENAGIGCRFDNQVVYQEIPVGSSGRALELGKVLSSTSAFPVTVNLSIQDENCTTQLWNGAASSSLIFGDIYYRKSTARTAADLMGTYGNTNFVGQLTVSTGSFSATPPSVFLYKGLATPMSSIDGGGAFPEFACRAIANFNGSASGGGPRMQKGMSVSRSTTGTYSAVFDAPFPDANYSVGYSFIKSVAITDAIEIASQTNTGFSVVIRDSAGALHDSSLVNLQVFR